MPPGTLTCQELVELVTDYLEGALSPGERARFEAHVAQCKHCPTYLDQMRTTIRLLHPIAPTTSNVLAEYCETQNEPKCGRIAHWLHSRDN
jgi:anti-sigma factor RsiW